MKVFEFLHGEEGSAGDHTYTCACSTCLTWWAIKQRQVSHLTGDFQLDSDRPDLRQFSSGGIWPISSPLFQGGRVRNGSVECDITDSFSVAKIPVCIQPLTDGSVPI